MRFLGKPNSPNEKPLEAGQGFAAALDDLTSQPAVAAKMIRERGRSGVLTYLRKAEVSFRKRVARALAAGVAEDAAVEGALASLSLSPNPEPRTSPDLEEQMNQLRLFVQSAPRTWPTEITV